MLPYRMRGKKETVYIVINNCQLVDDLITALDNFIEKLQKDTTWQSQCLNRIEDVNKNKDASNLRGNNIATSVKDQIEKAWELRGGLLNSKGNIIKFYGK